jgi:hypothetical protein
MTGVRGAAMPRGLALALLPGVLLAAVSAGCTSGDESTAAAPLTADASGGPGGSAETETPPPENATSETSPSVRDDAADPSSGRPLAAVRPCDLLSPVDRSTAGLTVLGREKSIGSARACDWTEPGAFGLTITVAGESTLDELEIERTAAEQVEIGGHTALRVADEWADDGTCAVLLAAGGTGTVHVDVSNTSFTGTEQACDRADTVAGLIAPKLPQQASGNGRTR